MSEKQPLVGGQPSAPPPAYQPPIAPTAPPAYAPQHGGYQGVGQQQQTSNTTVFIQPAQHTRTVAVHIKPPNYVVLSVITMVFFCWIFGLIGLLVGLQVDRAWLRGDQDEAFRCSRQARLWNILAIVFGVAIYVIFVTSVSISVSSS